jgi:oligopeptide/dipeptide ABC transporter ATP-binding protein
MQCDLLLKVDNLSAEFDTESGRYRAVEAVGFQIRSGQVVGLVGESGCGKSVTALSIMGLLPKPAGRVTSGRIQFKRLDLTRLDKKEMHAIRGRRIAMIFQEPMSALNPVHRIGNQIKEVLKLHFPQRNHADVETEALNLMQQVGIPSPQARMREYPHQISGGMRQRVMIAMALAGRPELLIADEPTTALDVTIQAQILTLMQKIQARTGMAILLITHDLGVVAQTCDQVVVMYAGRVVETAPVTDLFADPKHPYTQGLLESIPRLNSRPKTKLPIIPGVVPNLADMPSGCRFRNRCPQAMAICSGNKPELKRIQPGHRAACYIL